MSIHITDKTEDITITFIRFNDVFGKVVAIRGWQYQTNNRGE